MNEWMYILTAWCRLRDHDLAIISASHTQTRANASPVVIYALSTDSILPSSSLLQMRSNQTFIKLNDNCYIIKNWNQFLVVVKATALKQQISKF